MHQFKSVTNVTALYSQRLYVHWPLCFRPHKSAVYRAVTYFCSQVRAIDGSNSKLCLSWELTVGRGFQFIQKKCGERVCEVGGWKGNGWKLFWNYDSGCVLRVPRVSRLVSSNICRLQPFKLHLDAITYLRTKRRL